MLLLGTVSVTADRQLAGAVSVTTDRRLSWLAFHHIPIEESLPTVGVAGFGCSVTQAQTVGVAGWRCQCSDQKLS